VFRRGVSMRSLRWLGWMWRWIRRLHRHRRVGKKCVAPLAISPSPQRSLRPSVDTLALERSSCVFSHHSFSLSKTLSHSLSLSLSLSPQVGTPPLLDFSKLKSYESPHTTARYSAHGSMDQPPSPSTPTTLRYPEDAGGAAASGGGYPHTPSCVIRSRGGGFVVYRMCTAPAEPVSGASRGKSTIWVSQCSSPGGLGSLGELWRLLVSGTGLGASATRNIFPQRC
jgi:hypothetical protein